MASCRYCTYCFEMGGGGDRDGTSIRLFVWIEIDRHALPACAHSFMPVDVRGVCSRRFHQPGCLWLTERSRSKLESLVARPYETRWLLAGWPVKCSKATGCEVRARGARASLSHSLAVSTPRRTSRHTTPRHHAPYRQNTFWRIRIVITLLNRPKVSPENSKSCQFTLFNNYMPFISSSCSFSQLKPHKFLI
jgi:hypothetical protein